MCLWLMAVQEGIFNVPNLLRQAPRFLRSHLKARPNLVAFVDKHRVLDIYSNPNPHDENDLSRRFTAELVGKATR